MNRDTLKEQAIPVSLEEIANAARRSYTTVENMVCNVLREAIMSGVFRPGQRLQQDHIADILGVSRMPVRASLRQLEAEGLVVLHPHRGATVRALTPDEVAEIYELRIILESYAVKCVIERITDDDILELEALAVQVDTEPDPIQWLESRQLFYQRLYQIAGRSKLSELIAKLRAEVGRYWLMIRVTDEHSGHRKLLKLMEQGDSKAAVKWLEGHLTTVSQELQRLVGEGVSD